jgi:hypothetical protein
MIGKCVMAPIRATAGRVSLQMTGRALISLKVNDGNATSASFRFPLMQLAASQLVAARDLPASTS